MSGKLDTILGEVADDMEQEASDTRLGRVGWGIFKVNLILFVLSIPAYTLMGNMTSQALGGSTAVDSGWQMLDAALKDILLSVVRQSLPVTAVLVASWIIWGHIKRVPTVRRLLDGALLRTPIWGKVHRYRSVSRFLHLLDELYTAGINPSKAWEAASLAPRNSEIAEKLRLARREASATMGIADIAALSNVLEPEEVSLIATGERTGRVPDTLARLSGIYQDKAKLQKSIARVLSISLMNASLIAMSGAAIIILVLKYVGPIMGFDPFGTQ